MTSLDLHSLAVPTTPDDESGWAEWGRLWSIRSDTLYLNHGSFGPSPLPVREARREWIEMLDAQPMDFYVRHYEDAWLETRRRLAAWLQTEAGRLVFVENATAGMGVVAKSFPLSAGDVVLLNDHEYGAVKRIWQKRCAVVGAEVRIVSLPLPVESAEQWLDAMFAAVCERTRLLVVSHITSPTALIMPLQAICDRARSIGLPVCVDGPHAPAQVPIDLEQLQADFYMASCHKWLCAPLGSGFLSVAPRWQEYIQPLHWSWGRVQPRLPETWDDEFMWTGTRDPSPYFTIPAAIDFLQHVGEENFRARSHYLATYAHERLKSMARGEWIFPLNAHASDSSRSRLSANPWYGSMALVPLPDGDAHELQKALWTRYGIEIPIIPFANRRFVRVSCHLYNSPSDIDRLATALGELLE